MFSRFLSSCCCTTDKLKVKEEISEVKMMHLRFLSILLGFLLVMPGIRDYSSAHAHQDEKTARNWLVASNQGHIVSDREELVHGIKMRKLRLQGRTMAAQKVSGEEFEKDQQKKNKGTSEISGKSSEASKKSLERFHGQVDDQNDINMLKRKTSKSGSLGIPRSESAGPLSNSKPIQPQDSKASQTKTSLKNSPRSDNKVSQEVEDQTVETQRLLVATKEIVNLMNKDYKGMPRRKPPINNNEPRH